MATDTSVKHFYNTMPGIPQLTTQPGTFVAILNACLVDGFGDTAVSSLSITDGVATVSFSGANAAVTETVILLTGITGTYASLNGEQKVTGDGTGFCTFNTTLPNGNASGSINFKMAPAGWVKEFSGANKAVYRSPDPESTRMYLLINDDQVRVARRIGYEQMTDIDTGTGKFPSDTQIPGGGYTRKSEASSDTAPINFTIVCDNRGFYTNICPPSYTNIAYVCGQTYYTGDFEPLKVGGDPWAFIIDTYTSETNQLYGTCDGVYDLHHYCPRNHTGLGSSVNVYHQSEIRYIGASGTTRLFGTYPDSISGSLILSRKVILAGNSDTDPIRGIYPGLFVSPQDQVGMFISPRSIIKNTEGRSLLALGIGTSYVTFPSTSLGISFIDITGPWKR